MKFRNGFVSNSSSSSFVVRDKKMFEDNAILTDKERELLKDYGFQETWIAHPSKLEAMSYDEPIPVGDMDNCRHFACRVACNQDNVIKFLISNNIPFIAACNYGHNMVIYERDSNEVITIQNPGCIIETYGTDMIKEWEEYENVLQCITKIQKEEYYED